MRMANLKNKGMDHRVFQIATRGQCMKGEQCKHFAT